MAVVLGFYTAASLLVVGVMAFLSYLTYHLLSTYLRNWKEMKIIPGIDGTYPFIGNALQFKSNAGGEEKGDGKKGR